MDTVAEESRASGRPNRGGLYIFDTRKLMSNLLEGFLSLKGSPSELWKAYALKLLDSYAYFSFSIIFTLFLSSDFGFTDAGAGSVYGAWGALVTVYGLITGVIIDNLGIALSLRVGFVLSLISRSLIFMSSSRTVLLLNVCLLLPMGNCLGIPVLATGIRRYTKEESRGFAFGLFYVVMNIGALISGPVVDMCTIWYRGGKHSGGGERGVRVAHDSGDMTRIWSLSEYRLVLLTGIFANIIACFVAFTVREIKIDNNLSIDGAIPTNVSAKISTFIPVRGSAIQILRETMRAQSFWRFLIVCLLTLNVRMIFRHLDATLPKYMIREFGENTPKGSIYAINPALIIILVPIVQAATSKVDPLVMIHHGSYISALSVFVLVASTSVWACAVFVIILSVGESIWSPRLYDYTMSVCTEGREGTYMALSSAPLFLAKLPVGFLSGVLLEKYCPEIGPRNSKRMWMIIGLITATSPLCLTLFWKFISGKNETRQSTRYTELSEVDADEPNDLQSEAMPHKREVL